MYTTTRSIAGSTLTTCSDCGHAISMNKICETPLQSAANMLKHMAGHYVPRVFTAVKQVIRPEPKSVPSILLVADNSPRD
jgi:hypothetical protein